MRFFLLLGLGLGWVWAAHAQGDPGAVAADRPGFGDGAAVVAPGRVQVEAGYSYTDLDRLTQHSLGQAVLRVGVVPGVELRALLNSFVILDGPGVDVNGLEDLALGAKVNLLTGDGQPLGLIGLTAIVHVTIPTGSDAFSNDHLRPDAKLALDLALTETVGLSANAGYAFDLAGEPETLYTTYLSLGAAVPGVEGASAFVGLFQLTQSTTLFFKEVQTDHGLDGGFTYLPNAATQLDVSVTLGLSDGVPEVAVGAGIARRF